MSILDGHSMLTREDCVYRTQLHMLPISYNMGSHTDVAPLVSCRGISVARWLKTYHSQNAIFIYTKV